MLVVCKLLSFSHQSLLDRELMLDVILNLDYFFLTSKIKNCCYYIVCSGSVVVTAYDFESGRPGLSPEWGPIYY